ISVSSGSINSVSGEVGRSIRSSSHHSTALLVGHPYCHSVIGRVTSQNGFLLCYSTGASARSFSSRFSPDLSGLFGSFPCVGVGRDGGKRSCVLAVPRCTPTPTLPHQGGGSP